MNPVSSKRILMDTMEKKKIKVPLIGKIAVKHEFISKDQLKRALQICAEAENEGRTLTLAEVLVRTKIISPGDMKKLHDLKTDYEAKQQPIIDINETPVIKIASDQLKAELIIPKQFTQEISTEMILEMIREKGISHGIVNDSEITNIINNKSEFGVPKIIARGTHVYPGEPPVIEYFFDAEYYRDQTLEIGTAAGEKDRSIPSDVDDGDLLMEKNQMIPPDSGMSVLGEVIAVEPFEDVVLRSGIGTELYEKELKVVSAKKGRPFLSVEGRGHVFNEVIFSKDYGVATGAVEADSSLKVKGIVTGEYPVKGGSVSATEIRGADIDIIGDIDVEIGITGSVIRCQGDVRARYIRGSFIETCGSVIVDMEIMDSKIFASGICKSKNSKIVASVIAAKRGVEANGIGTATSIPCEITIGRDLNLKHRIMKIDSALETNTIRREELKTITFDSKERQIDINQQVVAKMEYHKQIKNAITATDNNIAVLQLKDAPDQLAKAKMTLVDLKKKNRVTVEQIRAFSDSLKQIGENLAEIPKELLVIEAENYELELDKAALLKWGEGSPVNPVLIVKEDVAAGTIVSSGNAYKEFKKKIEKIKITEQSVPETDPPEWKIEISSL